MNLDQGMLGRQQAPSKHNFTIRDLTRVLLALWTHDDLIYIHDRHRVQATFLIHAYCWTGARINTFFKGGAQYKVLHSTKLARAPIADSV